jgi:uncharacterized protein
LNPGNITAIITRVKDMPSQPRSLIAFDGERRLAAGSIDDVARAAKRAVDAGIAGPLLVFDAHSSRPVEFDLRGSEADVMARLGDASEAPATAARGPGRPRLGVIAREVTLLPRHWDWLSREPGGASAALRRLVEQAMRGDGAGARAQAREAGESVDRFMLAMAGDLPGYEEASRALWRGDRTAFEHFTERWPADVRDHLQALATRAWGEPVSGR